MGISKEGKGRQCKRTTYCVRSPGVADTVSSRSQSTPHQTQESNTLHVRACVSVCARACVCVPNVECAVDRMWKNGTWKRFEKHTQTQRKIVQKVCLCPPSPRG